MSKQHEQKKSMRGIVVTIDRVDGTNAAESVSRYAEIKQLLTEHFSGLRIRFGAAEPPGKTRGE